MSALVLMLLGMAGVAADAGMPTDAKPSKISQAVEPSDLVNQVVNPAEPSIRYFIIPFASTSRDGTNRIEESHTWALFVKTNAAREVVETQTISWMPATGIIRPLSTSPEVGKNYSLEETFAWTTKLGAIVKRWGPYEIVPELYERAAKRVMELENGMYKYVILDSQVREQRLAFHCIHALSDIIGPKLQTIVKRGDDGTEAVIMHFRPYFLNVGQDHEWLIRQLGLTRFAWITGVHRSADRRVLPTVLQPEPQHPLPVKPTAQTADVNL